MYNVLLSDNNNNKNIDKSNNDNKKCVCFATKNMHSKRSPQLRFYQLRARELKTFFCYWLVSQNVWHKINQPMTKMIKVQPEMSESDMEKRSLCVCTNEWRGRANEFHLCGVSTADDKVKTTKICRANVILSMLLRHARHPIEFQTMHSMRKRW